MKSIKKMMLAGLLLCVLAGCKTTGAMRTYYLSDDRFSSDISMSLSPTSDTEGTFQMAFPDIRLIPYGKYTIEDGILTCTTFDNFYRFRFQVNDDDTYTFIANGSTESITDGAVFAQKKEEDKKTADSAE